MKKIDDLFKLLAKSGYNTYADKQQWEREHAHKEVITIPLSIYLNNGYVIHLKKELEPYIVHIGDLVIIGTQEKKVAFFIDEVASIMIKG